MRKILLMILVCCPLAGMVAQKYFTREGKISFYSDAPMEKIEAHNGTATAILDSESGRIEFGVLVKAFNFEKALMQEHFNENYMESGKFPKATFKGQIVKPETVNFGKDGTYQAKVKGDLTMHGETRPVETDAVFTVKGGVISAKSTFEVAVADYKIQIPAVVRDKVAKNVKIEVAVDLKPYVQ